MLRRIIGNPLNKYSTSSTQVPAASTMSIYRSISKAHKEEIEKQKRMPDINPETDADRWSNPGDYRFVDEEMTTPKQIERDEKMRSDEFKSEFQQTDPNLAWRGFEDKDKMEEEIDKKGIQSRD